MSTLEKDGKRNMHLIFFWNKYIVREIFSKSVLKKLKICHSVSVDAFETRMKY